MSCIIDTGHIEGCPTIGGIKNIYLGTFASGATYTLDADDIITAVASGGTVYKFEQESNTSGAEQTINPSKENGTTFMETVISLKMTGFNASVRNSAVALSRAPVFAVLQSRAGVMYLIGNESSGRLSEGTTSLGIAAGDRNGSTLSFKFESPKGLYLLADGVLGTDITIG